MSPNEFECAVCHGVFEKGWSEEEAHAERRELWPEFEAEDCDLVCDDCHTKFMQWFNSEGGRIEPNAHQ